jgi:hypothetical protein
MARIKRTQLGEVLGILPTVLPLEASPQDQPDDLFVCALGFEPRCLTIPEHFASSGYRTRRAVYLTYKTNPDDNAANQPRLLKSLNTIGDHVSSMGADTEEFAVSFRALLESIENDCGGRCAQVAVDVSVMANRAVLRVLNVLLESNVGLRLVYAEAAIYHPTESEYESQIAEWAGVHEYDLETGVSDVLLSTDHPGNSLDSLPDAVFVFPTFKVERTKAVIGWVDPSLLAREGGKVVWLLGRPHLHDDEWRLGAMRALNALSTESRQQEVSTFDYRETIDALESLHEEFSSSHRITISPLGSKLQALGTALFCYLHPDVRVVFSAPGLYNAAHYSQGCKAKWAVDFGSLHELRGKLDRVGMLKIED